MDAKVITEIERLVNERERVMPAPGYAASGAYIVFNPQTGEPTHAFAGRAPALGRLESTQSLASLIRHDMYTLRYGEEGEDPRVRCFYNEAGLVAIMEGKGDAENEARWHRMDLPRHRAHLAVDKLLTTRPLSQRALIRFLRAELNGHVSESVIERFRALKVTTDGEDHRVVAKGREAVDKRIQQQILEQGGQEIPESIVVTIPIYDIDELRDELYSVEILVEASTNEEGQVVFELTTVANSLAAARYEALQHVMARFDQALAEFQLDADVELYQGVASMPELAPFYHRRG